jgi:tetratricopeptide (TPR) repeat protein
LADRGSDQTGVRSFGPWIALAGLLLVTFVAYIPALNGEFVWDDNAYVSENPLLRDLDGLKRIWFSTDTPQYYPLVFTTFWVEYHLWGLDTTGYHVVNVLLHALNALLIGLVLRALGLRWGWWVALLFALHPVHVESVAWITERKNVLSALFYLLSLLAFLRFDSRRARPLYWVALVLFFCALLSKTVTSTLPVVLLLALWFQKKKLTRNDLINVLPFFALALVMGLVTVRLEEGMVEVVRGEFDFTLLQRGLIAARALVFYAVKLIWPHPLIFNYPRWDLDLAAWQSLASIALVTAGAVLVLLAWRRGLRGVVCALLFYVITLFPALGLFNVYPFRYSFVADHFQYLASVGILALLVGAADALARKRNAGRTCRIVGVVLLAVLAVMTWNQAGAYRDLETLWRDTIEKNPGSWIAHSNLALILLVRGDTVDALAQFDQAIQSNPGSAESHTGRGMARARLGRNEAALEDFDRALELDPTYPQAYIHRGELLFRLGMYERAIDDLDRVLSSNPSYLDGYGIRARARVELGQYDAAIADFSEAIRRGAGIEALNDRGIACLRAGRVDAAVNDFDRVLELAPLRSDIRHNRGVALARAGRIDEALADFNVVLEQDATALGTWLFRGRVYQGARGDLRRACEDWRQACRLGDCRPFEAHCAEDSNPG